MDPHVPNKYIVITIAGAVVAMLMENCVPLIESDIDRQFYRHHLVHSKSITLARVIMALEIALRRSSERDTELHHVQEQYIHTKFLKWVEKDQSEDSLLFPLCVVLYAILRREHVHNDETDQLFFSLKTDVSEKTLTDCAVEKLLKLICQCCVISRHISIPRKLDLITNCARMYGQKTWPL